MFLIRNQEEINEIARRLDIEEQESMHGIGLDKYCKRTTIFREDGKGGKEKCYQLWLSDYNGEHAKKLGL